MASDGEKILNIPVRYMDGVFQLEYGGGIPLYEGTRAELVVAQSDVTDRSLIDRYTARRDVKVFDYGTPLLIMLGDKVPISLEAELLRAAGLPTNIYAKLGIWEGQKRYPVQSRFLPVTVGRPATNSKLPHDDHTGGLWFRLEGLKVIGMTSSDIDLPPGLAVPSARSLNHAYTVLSEHFERHRISHTGNAYEQVFYRETNNLWYPLKAFRDGEIAKQEHLIAKRFWADIEAHMSARGD